MRRFLTLAAAIALLALPLAACGDDDEETLTGAGETTATPSGSGSGIATAGEFADAALPDQVKAVKAEVAANPDCKGVDAKAGGQFQVDVAIDAASASSDTPLSEIVGGQCSEN